MAVFKQELNWSTFQDLQFKALQSIGDSLSKSLKISQSLSNSMSNIEKAISAIAHASEVSAQNIAAMTKEWTGSAVEYTRQLKEASKATATVADDMGDASDNIRSFNKEVKSSSKDLASSIGNAVSTISSTLGRLQGVARTVDEFSDLSNRMIQLSGMSGDAVRNFKSEVMNVISDLNRSTGNLYSPLESYQRVISYAQGVTSDLDAITELARPLLLSYETLDVNINTVAETFNKFYVRYNFSSLHMEKALEEIRGNTAGNSANAEDTFENINKLEGMIEVIAKGDEEKILSMMEQVSQITSHAESQGIDSQKFIQWIYDIYAGDFRNNPEILTMLSKVGIDPLKSQESIANADILSVYEDLLGGAHELLFPSNGAPGLLDYTTKKDASENFGFDYDSLMDLYGAFSSDNYQPLEEFLDQATPKQSLEELAEDKYVSAVDKTNHWLERIYSTVASIQEMNPLGFGLSDLIVGSMLLDRLVSGGRSLTGSVGNLGSGTLGKLTSVGYNMSGGVQDLPGGGVASASLSGGKAAALGSLGVAGVAAGGLIAVDGVTGLLDKEANSTSKALSAAEVGFGAIGALGVGASMAGVSTIAGLATGPIGWVALGIAAMAMTVKKVNESITPLSGAAETVEAEFDNLKDSFYDEQMRRSAQLESLEKSIVGADNFDEALKIAKDSGLLPLEDISVNTTEELLNMISAIRETNEELINLQDAAFKAAEGIVKDEAKKQDAQIEEELYKKVSSYMTDGTLREGEKGYGLVKGVFTQIAESITDETAKKKALADVEKIFSNGILSDSELKFLTDTGGSGRAFWSFELDRKDNAFRQAGDFDLKNSALGLLGISGYDMSSMDAVKDLTSIYSSWMNATTKSEKDEYAKQYKEILSGLNEDLQSIYAPQAKEMGITSYDVGTNYVERDKIALLHEGEAVVPKRYNPAANSAEFKELVTQMSRENSEEAQESREYLRTFVSELKEIRTFLTVWKEDNVRRETVSESRKKFELGRNYISSYQIER